MLSPRSYAKQRADISRDAPFVIACALVLAAAAAMRFYGLTRQSAWADELWTLLITDPALSFAEFWRRVVADTHPPLYYLLMRGWSELFGQSDFAARLPSAVFGVLTVAAGGFFALSRAGRLAL